MIYGLPTNVTDRELRSLLLFSSDLVHCEIVAGLNVRQSKSAIAMFRSAVGAQQAQRVLDGKPDTLSGGGKLFVRTLAGETTMDPMLSRRNTHAGATHTSHEQFPFNSPTSSHGGSYSSLDQISPPNSAPAEISAAGRTSLEFPSPEANDRYQNYGSSSPLKERYADLRHHVPQPGPQLGGVDEPMAELSLRGPSFDNVSPYYQPQQSVNDATASLAYLSIGAMSPSSVDHGGPRSSGSSYTQSSLQTPMTPGAFDQSLESPNSRNNMPQRRIPHMVYPPINPADQNDPCNTLYVGNLPMNTSEDELKALFSKQRGYKRLCFRTKANGPMCFVEFDDISYATRALNELYGHLLSNSVKGGIRLSFSKNPLGVRSGQHPGRSISPMNFGNLNMGGLPTPQTSGFPSLVQAPPGLPSRQYGSGHETGIMGSQMSPFAASFGMMARPAPLHPQALSLGVMTNHAELNHALGPNQHSPIGYLQHTYQRYSRNLPGD